MSPKLVDALLLDYNQRMRLTGTANGFAAFLNDEITIVNRVQKVISIANRTMDQKQKEYDTAKKDYDTEIREAQKICKHWLRHYEADPAGGNDSSTQCTICGKYL
jgi:hypothetical protein